MTTNEKSTLSVQEVASYLRIGKNLAYEAIQRGEIPHNRIGGRILVPVVALNKMLAAAGSGEDAGTE